MVHRKRSIKDFIAGKFPTHKSSPIGSKYFSELTEVELDYFLGYELTFKIFTNLTDKFQIQCICNYEFRFY